jgi:hypothetical protein
VIATSEPSKENPMLRTTTIGLITAASLTLVPLSSALADIPGCMKQPNADTCPTMGAPTLSKASEQATPKPVKHARYHQTQSPNKG